METADNQPSSTAPATAGDPLADIQAVLAETKAITDVVERLAVLSPDSRQKVWRYVTDWLSKSLKPISGNASLVDGPSVNASVAHAAPVSGGLTLSSYSSLAELFGAIQPDTDALKALVVGLWLQDREGHSEISPQTVNRELMHLGHKIGNITRAFDTLRNSKPQWASQKRKDGTSKQARKSFIVTHEGRKEVERRLRGDA